MLPGLVDRFVSLDQQPFKAFMTLELVSNSGDGRRVLDYPPHGCILCVAALDWLRACLHPYI